MAAPASGRRGSGFSRRLIPAAVWGVDELFLFVLWGRVLTVELFEQSLWKGIAVFFISVQLSVCFYRVYFQASWLRCTRALCSFRSVVDVEAGTRVGPKGVCSSCTAAFTVLNSCGRQMIVWFICFGASVLCRWFARRDPLRAVLCGWGKALFYFALISLDLLCCYLVNSEGAMHHVPYVAMPFAAFCNEAKKTLNREVSASGKTCKSPVTWYDGSRVVFS